MSKKALLINPPVYDVQFWGEWSQPHGLLKVGSYLNKQGYETKLLDCLYVMPKKRVKKKILSVVELGSKPLEIPYRKFQENKNSLTPIQRFKYIFGLNMDDVRKELIGMSGIHETGRKNNKVITKNLFSDKVFYPDEIWITSIMTYWWESTVDISELCKEIFPSSKVRIGGIYPTLAPEHLKKKTDESGLELSIVYGYALDLSDKRDLIVIGEIPQASWEDIDLDVYFEPEANSSSRYYHGPKIDENGYKEAIVNRNNYGPNYSILTTTRGCPFDCAYCAQRAYNLYDNSAIRDLLWTSEEKKKIFVRTRGSNPTLSEIRKKYHQYGIKQFAFYEDNFLMAKDHFREVLEGIISDRDLRGNLQLHAPEGIEIRLIDDELAKLMYEAGFKRIYLPLENINTEVIKSWNRSHSNVQMFENAVENCINAGYKLRNMDLNAFVLFGTPGESIRNVVDSAIYASSKIGSVIPMLFTPVPGSHMFAEYEDYLFKEMKFDLQHLNGKLFPFFTFNKRIYSDLEIQDYLDLEGLMFRLNAKAYRGSFDIGSDSLIARTFRQIVSSYS